MTARQVLEKWIECFNRADVKGLAELYHEDAINHQVAYPPVVGRESIHKVLATEFANTKMVCIVENIFEDKDWAILEWKDPKGLRGCGFFQIVNNKIKFQRGYWDRLSFQELYAKDLRE